jgi:uncharacterized protein (DUF1499 family)
MTESAVSVAVPKRWLFVSVVLLLAACSGREVTIGIVDGRLAPCPDRPNCVSSDATDEEHRVEPYRLKAAPVPAWHGLQNVLAAEPRTRLITIDERYLHVEVESAVFRFVDDTEFLLRPAEGLIAVRSAARTGYSDFGVNRKRVERIRDALRARNLVE